MSELPGNFEPYFWDHFVLQFSHQDPAIRYSLVALSAIYEDHELKIQGLNQSPKQRSHSLALYMKAVHHLTDALSSSQIDTRVVLVCCLIFVWIDVLQDNLFSAFKHLESGAQILQDSYGHYSRTIISDFEDIFASLTRSFTRLVLQASVHGRGASPSPYLFPKLLRLSTQMPKSFSNIFESRNYLDNELNSLFGALRSLQNNKSCRNEKYVASIDEMCKLHLQRLQQWKLANDSLVEFHALTENIIPDTVQSSGMAYLQLYYHFLMIILPCILSEKSYDNHTATFAQIVSLSKSILETPYSGPPRVLSFDMGIIPPLFLTTLKCRILPLRRMAISLLKLAPEREGLWHRDSIVAYSEWKVAFEEQGRGDLPETSLLPESARIYEEHLSHRIIDGKTVEVFRFRRGEGEQQEMLLPKELEMAKSLGNMI